MWYNWFAWFLFRNGRNSLYYYSDNFNHIFSGESFSIYYVGCKLLNKPIMYFLIVGACGELWLPLADSALDDKVYLYNFI